MGGARLTSVVRWAAILGGAAVVVAGFWVVLGAVAWNAAQWLDLVVSLGVYGALVRLPLALAPGTKTSAFDKSATILGARWVFTLAYSVAATAGMVVAAILQAPFKYALWYQCVLAVGAAFQFLTLLAVRTRRDDVVERERRSLELGVDALQRQARAALENALGVEEAQRMATLAERLRFLSACSTAEAAGLDAQLFAELAPWASGAAVQLTESEARAASLERLERLLRRRMDCREA